MKKLLILLLLFVPSLLHAQGTQIVTVTADPATCNTGMLYFNSTTNTLKTCGPNNTWAAAGGGLSQVTSLPATCTTGTTSPVQLTVANGIYGAGIIYYCSTTNTWTPVAQGSGASPIMAYYFGPQCPASNTSQCFFTPANTQIANDCTWGTGAATVTCASSHFTAADVGKRVAGYFKTDSFGSTFGCVAGRISFNVMTTSALTISTFTSGTSISLSGNPSTAATGNNGCFIWGTPDDTNASAFETAYAAVSTFCPKVMLAAANYWFSSPHFSSQPTGCVALPSLVGNSTTTGNQVYSAGFELEGRGAGDTVIYLGPDFPNGDSCARTQNNITNACFLVPVEGKWTDLQISGGGQLSSCGLSAKTLLGVTVGTLNNVTLTNMCSTVTNMIGIQADLLSQLYQVNSSGWGNVCLQVPIHATLVQAYKLACENSPGPSNVGLGSSVDISASDTSGFPTFTCWGCLLLGAITNNSYVVYIHSGGANIVKIIGGIIENCEASSGCTNVAGGDLIINFGSTLYLDNVQTAVAGGATNTGGLGCASSGVNYLINTNLTNNGNSNYANGSSACTLVDEGGNGPLFTGTTGLLGPVQADGRSLMFSCTGTANASATNSLYGSGPNVTATTCAGQTSTLGAGIPFQNARTISGTICTSSATTVSVACTVMVNGSATSAPTCTMTASQRCIDFAHPLAVNPGDLLSARIVTGAAETGANIKMQVLWQ